MRIIKDPKAVFLNFIADRKFTQRNYKEAARLFEKAIKYESDINSIVINYFRLGQCYTILKRYNEALEVMNNAYELFNNNEEVVKDSFKKQEYNKFLKAYSYVLNKIGDIELSKKISEECE